MDNQKHIEFRSVVHFRKWPDCKALLIYTGGQSRTTLPILVKIRHIDPAMSVGEAIQRYPKQAKVSDLAGFYKGKLDKKIYCIHLAAERTPIAITLLKPLNLHNRPQIDPKSQKVTFCMPDEVGRTVLLPDGSRQHLVPIGFAAKARKPSKN